MHRDRQTCSDMHSHALAHIYLLYACILVNMYITGMNMHRQHIGHTHLSIYVCTDTGRHDHVYLTKTCAQANENACADIHAMHICPGVDINTYKSYVCVHAFDHRLRIMQTCTGMSSHALIHSICVSVIMANTWEDA